MARIWSIPLSAVAVLHLACSVMLLAQPTADLDSPKLRAHANLPKYFRAGPPLTTDLANARVGAASRGIAWRGLDFVVYDADNIAELTATGAEQLYRKLACQADSIVIGHTRLSASHLSAFGTVYTDYILVIQHLLKDNSKSPIRSAGETIVTRPGGSLLVNDDPVSFDYQGFPALQSDITYLQFLQYIPESSAYQAVNSYSTLSARGNDWVVERQPSGVALPGLPRGVLEKSLKVWLTSCQ